MFDEIIISMTVINFCQIKLAGLILKAFNFAWKYHLGTKAIMIINMISD